MMVPPNIFALNDDDEDDASTLAADSDGEDSESDDEWEYSHFTKSVVNSLTISSTQH